jgi:hypothetical protein
MAKGAPSSPLEISWTPTALRRCLEWAAPTSIGTLAVSICFCQEALDRIVTDRFASFISTFEMATSNLLQSGALHSTS